MAFPDPTWQWCCQKPVHATCLRTHHQKEDQNNDPTSCPNCKEPKSVGPRYDYVCLPTQTILKSHEIRRCPHCDNFSGFTLEELIDHLQTSCPNLLVKCLWPVSQFFLRSSEGFFFDEGCDAEYFRSKKEEHDKSERILHLENLVLKQNSDIAHLEEDLESKEKRIKNLTDKNRRVHSLH